MTLQATDDAPRGLVGVVDRMARLLDRRTSRRGFLSRVAVVGSAVAVSPVGYALRPGTAYAAVCGNDSACSSGYTIFCATINNGVNRCPPGALVGGWWKADGSSFCCGSARYYIDCHSYCSCGCGGGTSFCGPGCRACNCGCGPGDSCDQRRVCCNNFRYGQCNQDVGCTGPVWCRVATCTPPWRIPQWKCTATSATDNRTASHTAPALSGCTDIVQKYTALGGQGGKLGEPLTAEQVCGDGVGRFNNYDGGGLIWHPQYGAHAFYYVIRDKYYALQGERGKLGYATSDEIQAIDRQGYFNHFVGGDIWWHPRWGTNALFYAIRDTFYSLGWEQGKLGYPTSDEIRCNDGVGYYNHFVGGDVYWHPRYGTHAMYYAIRDKYTEIGRESAKISYVTSDEVRCADGVGYYNEYVGGLIYWHPRYGTHVLYWAIRDEYLRLGREQGRLGYVTADETVGADGRGYYNTFVGGDVYWHPDYGTHAVLGQVRDKYVALGRDRGGLSYPVSDQLAAPRSGEYADFAGSAGGTVPDGSIYWTPSTGAWSVSGPIRTEWLRRGGAGGSIGFPVSDPQRSANGVVTSTFEYATMSYDPASGTVTVTPR